MLNGRFSPLVVTTSATAAGRTTPQNTQRQPGPSTSSPPTSGPSTAPSVKIAVNSPIQRPRWRGETTSPTMMNASDISPPPPSPWSARASTSVFIVGASAHSTEPTMNTDSAVWYTTRRPNRSDIFP